MKNAAWTTLVFGIIVLIGGIMGRIHAASTISLVTGISFGVLLIGASLGMFKNHLLPAYFGIILILMLDAFFTYRWLVTYSFLPSGLMALVSIGVLVFVVFQLRHDLKSQRKGR